MKKNFFAFSIAVLFVNIIHAQNKICKTWYTQGKESLIQIFLAADGKYYGKIVWLKDEKPQFDVHNPDASKRSKPILGLVIISGLTKKSETEFVGGKIYDPTKGYYYSCKATVVNDKQLDLRGYILGMPFLGRTTTFYLKEETPKVVKPLAPLTQPTHDSVP